MIPPPRKGREKLAKKRKSESAKEDSEEVGRTYGIDRLNIGEDNHDSYEYE